MQELQIQKKYVGIFSGLHFLRSVVKAQLIKAFGENPDNWDTRIIVVERVAKGTPNAYVHEYKKRIRKGRKSIRVTKKEYYLIEFTNHDSYRLSVEPMPVRSWEYIPEIDMWADWVIPAPVFEENKHSHHSKEKDEEFKTKYEELNKALKSSPQYRK